MPLMVHYAFITKDVFIKQFLQLKKSGCFVATNIPKIIRAAAAN
jgi:hypothetical protein